MAYKICKACLPLYVFAPPQTFRQNVCILTLWQVISCDMECRGHIQFVCLSFRDLSACSLCTHRWLLAPLKGVWQSCSIAGPGTYQRMALNNSCLAKDWTIIGLGPVTDCNLALCLQPWPWRMCCSPRIRVTIVEKMKSSPKTLVCRAYCESVCRL